jgi:hypothetical protein
MTPTLRLASFVFAGFLFGTAADMALASEAATAMAPPAARLGEIESCRIVAPRFQPIGHARTEIEAANFLGGAKLRPLVAAPCRRPPRPFDV